MILPILMFVGFTRVSILLKRTIATILFLVLLLLLLLQDILNYKTQIMHDQY